ncbi:MAG: hypothetical protein KBC41_01200 [Candidatus Pacebacteria bacterium]|nr:hypothetical protein [Candidatus Paceibacterota bacterium]MBP9866679.1 hypothetical protein [Candidatus Paceibacterota bacterium]
MKKTFFVILSIYISVISLHNTTYAANQVAGALEPTQIMNNVELGIIDFATVDQLIQDTLLTRKTVILDVIEAGLISYAQQTAIEEIVAWANGGFNESDSLIVSNPEKYILGEGRKIVMKNLQDIPTGTAFGDSIFSAILNNSKEVSTASQLKELSNSPYLATLQKNTCDGDTILDMAQKAAESEGGSEEEIRANYDEFHANYFDSFCNNNPNEDPSTASNLEELAKYDSSVSGWDGWLISINDNKFTRTQEALKIVENDKQKKETFATKELYDGLGTLSQKGCADDVTDMAECLNPIILNPGKVVQDTLSAAANAQLERISNLTGADGIAALITEFITSSLKEGLNKTIQNNLHSSNDEETIGSTAPPTQDFLNNTEKKEQITAPILKQLNFILTVLTDLEKIDNDFLSSMISYENRIQDGRTCFNTLVIDYPLLANTTDVVNAYAFYTERQGRVDTVRTEATNEKIKIGEARSLVTETQLKIASTNSSQELTNIYKEYSNAYEDGGYPTNQILARRKGDYQQAQSNVRLDTATSPSEGDMILHEKKCKSLRSSQEQGNGGSR